jgi:hypothetical protein
MKRHTLAPPRIRPSRNITARSYSCTTYIHHKNHLILYKQKKNNFTLRQTVSENGKVKHISAYDSKSNIYPQRPRL